MHYSLYFSIFVSSQPPDITHKHFISLTFSLLSSHTLYISPASKDSYVNFMHFSSFNPSQSPDTTHKHLLSLTFSPLSSHTLYISPQSPEASHKRLSVAHILTLKLSHAVYFS